MSGVDLDLAAGVPSVHVGMPLTPVTPLTPVRASRQERRGTARFARRYGRVRGVVLIVLGLSAFATLKGITAVLRVRTVDTVVIELPHGQDLPGLVSAGLGMQLPTVAWVLGLVIGIALLAATGLYLLHGGRARA